MPAVYPELHSSPVVTKLENPVLTKDDVPYDSALVFNAAVGKYCGKYVMIFRNDYGTDQESFENGKGFGGTNVGIAYSDNGIDHWEVRKTPLVDSHDFDGTDISRLYDPRLTIIDGTPYLCLAMDTKHGIRGAIAKLNDSLDKYEILSVSAPDNRNMVLFPERINGKYVRLERPMPVYSRGRDRFDMWIAQSPDLKYWGDNELVMGVEDVPYANDKIGPAAPPIKTEAGWLTLFHAVDIDRTRGKNGWEGRWQKRYCAGIALLDLNDPSKIIGMSKEPLLAPENVWETDRGFRQNVIFPCSMIAETDGTVRMYYGASDTVVCLATADVNDLIGLCRDKR